MGVHICEGDDATFLYCSTSMRPVNTESFADAEAAESFLDFAAKRGVDVRACKPADLDAMREDWAALPRCADCDLPIVRPAEDDPSVCAGCGG